MSIARKLALVAAIVINLAAVAAVAWIWLNWSWVYQKGTWEMVIWAFGGGLVVTLGETLAFYAGTGKWMWL